MNKADWVWMPHPGHLIISHECRFHLNTYVGGFLVSTLGEYFPDEGTREILAQSRKIQLVGRGDARRADYMEKIGYEDIGAGRKYETVVFFAQAAKGSCCPWQQESGRELCAAGHNTPEDAFAGHVKMCERYAAIDIELERKRIAKEDAEYA